MDFSWVAIALGDATWISLAFALGLLARFIGLPPLVGFLATGFLLQTQGITSTEFLEQLAELGITLLLFTVGLKLSLQTLARPEVWAVTGLHTSLVVAIAGLVVYALALASVPLFADLDFSRCLIVAFAMSFSSTVFVVKSLEERGAMRSLHGRVAVGILIMQDLAAAAFLALSAGKIPSPWSLLLLLLIPSRPVLLRLLQYVGHGELLVLYGFMLALGGAEIFEWVGFKGDLGALAVGILVANHPKSQEMAKKMLDFKDLFLVGFFLSIGLSGRPSVETLLVGAAITPFVFLKSALFFTLLSGFKLRARTSLMVALNLTNFSEFGLIVAAIGVSNGWIRNEWLIVLAIALSFSFAIAAILNGRSNQLYNQHRAIWRRLQRDERLPDDPLIDIRGATIAVVGMGRVGTGAYDEMRNLHGDTVIGVDSDPLTVERHRSTGRTVLLGDPSDADFWDRVAESHTLGLAMLALPKLTTNLAVLDQLREARFSGEVAATARFPDEVDVLNHAGATTVFNIYTEAGTGFAAHVASQLPLSRTPSRTSPLP